MNLINHFCLFLEVVLGRCPFHERVSQSETTFFPKAALLYSLFVVESSVFNPFYTQPSLTQPSF